MCLVNYDSHSLAKMPFPDTRIGCTELLVVVSKGLYSSSRKEFFKKKYQIRLQGKIMISLNYTYEISCQYTNYTSQFQIVRISNISNWFFERTVIPKSCILFEAFQESQLEVYTNSIICSILSDIIPCAQLIRPCHMKNS